MAIESRDILKTFFETGDIPTQDQFDDVLDSYIHKEDDGVTIYNVPSTTEIRFGIHNPLPEAPLGIKATDVDNTLVGFNKSVDDNASWFINLNPGGGTESGFNIDQALISGNTSRLFIDESDGFVGLGTTHPIQKLHVENSAGGDGTGVHLLNSATVINQGFGLVHENNADTDVDGSFSIYENTFTQANKRLTIRPGGRVGINELTPDTFLHVARDLADAHTDLDLIEGTGIVTIGPITDNIVADYRGIQARHGEYIGSDISLTAAELNFQRLGGDILIHGDSTIDVSSQGIITDDARLGLGIITPQEKIHIDGAILIGTSINTNDGTIRYTGLDFEGRKSGAWVSLTGGSSVTGPWIQSGSTVYYVSGTTSRVAIGSTTPAATLDVNDQEIVTAGNTAALIYNHSQTSSTDPNDNRITLEIKSDTLWGGNDQSKNIGLYISGVSGQTAANVNIAAVMNGNVVIGDIVAGEQAIGAAGTNVLAIQNGAVPTGVADTGSVQIYSADLDGHPTLNVMRGDGDVVKLYRETALTAADTTPLTDSYTTDTEAVIENLRTRLIELETRLQNLGFLA